MICRIFQKNSDCSRHHPATAPTRMALSPRGLNEAVDFSFSRKHTKPHKSGRFVVLVGSDRIKPSIEAGSPILFDG